MLIRKASSNINIFAAGRQRGAIYEVSSLAVDRASKSSSSNRTTRENNENKETRHA
jgi:hypothetical protein